MPRKGQRCKGVYMNCEYCNKKMWVQNCRVRKWKAKYCNEECRNKSMMTVVKDEKEICNYYNLGNSVIKSAIYFKIGKSVIERILRKNDIKIRTANHYTRGENNPNYKGGYITKDGYKRKSYGGKHEFEHRKIMEDYIGRKLLRNEHVHHLNGIKLDNRIENLSILTPKPHGELHAKQFNDWKKMYQSRIADLEFILRKCICRKDK